MRSHINGIDSLQSLFFSTVFQSFEKSFGIQKSSKDDYKLIISIFSSQCVRG